MTNYRLIETSLMLANITKLEKSIIKCHITNILLLKNEMN